MGKQHLKAINSATEPEKDGHQFEDLSNSYLRVLAFSCFRDKIALIGFSLPGIGSFKGGP